MTAKDIDLEDMVNFLCEFHDWKRETAVAHMNSVRNGFKSNYDEKRFYATCILKFANWGAYRTHLAQRKHFRNGYHRCVQRLIERGFDSGSKYQLALFASLGDKTSHNYETRRIRENPRMQSLGIKDREDYFKMLAKEHLKQPEYKLFIEMVKNGLKNMNQTHKWLGEILDVREKTISMYMNGFYLPDKDKFKKILDALEISRSRVHPILRERYNEKYKYIQ